MNEFALIDTYFAPLAIPRRDVVLSIGDDCAITQVPHGLQLCLTTDTLVSGVHFTPDATPSDIGYKSLAVNLSDLAAMGADPAWVTLTITLPTFDHAWLQAFAHGFSELLQEYQIALIGGDVTRGPLSITVQAAGFVPQGFGLRRSGAEVGDSIYVTHTVGDAALGLQVLQQKLNLAAEYRADVLNHLHRPAPRIALGQQLLKKAHAAIDISDGLVADLTHILTRSQVGATVFVDQIPLSPALKSLAQEEALQLALTGGDDYELCFTLPKTRPLPADFPATCIGEINTGNTLDLRFSDGTPYQGASKGYQHF